MAAPSAGQVYIQRREESSPSSASSHGPIISSSSSDSLHDPAFKCESKTVPRSNSKWSRGNLEGIGVFYDSEVKPLSDIRDIISKGQGYNKIPEICTKLIEFTNTVWNFSLDLKVVEKEQYRLGMSEINRLKAEFLLLEDDLRLQNSDLLKQPLNAR